MYLDKQTVVEHLRDIVAVRHYTHRHYQAVCSRALLRIQKLEVALESIAAKIDDEWYDCCGKLREGDHEDDCPYAIAREALLEDN